MIAYGIVGHVAFGVAELSTECESFVFELSIEASEEIGSCTSQSYTVFAVNSMVSVLVYIMHIPASEIVTVVCHQTGRISFCLSGEHACYLIAVELIRRLSDFCDPVAIDDSFFTTQRSDFIIVMGDITTYNPFEITGTNQ